MLEVKNAQGKFNFLDQELMEISLYSSGFKEAKVEKYQLNKNTEFYLVTLKLADKKEFTLEVEQKNNYVNLKIVNYLGIYNTSKLSPLDKLNPLTYFMGIFGKRVRKLVKKETRDIDYYFKSQRIN